MTNSSVPESLEEKRTQRRAQRLERVKQWVDYVEATSPQVWGAQLNTVVNAQLEAAREAGLSVENYQRLSRTRRENRADSKQNRTDGRNE